VRDKQSLSVRSTEIAELLPGSTLSGLTTDIFFTLDGLLRIRVRLLEYCLHL